MSETPNTGPTRRKLLSIGAGAALTTGLAGCASTETTDDASGEHTVTMEPMGEVTFDSVPETWMAYFSTYGDMGIALGQLEGLQGLIYTENWPLEFYETLPGVDVSFDDVPQLTGSNGIDKEIFYEMDCDVHLMDPNFVARLDDNWDDDDFEEIETNIGPIVGNSIRRRDEDWHDYRYYDLYEAFEIIATLFDERERYEELEAIHDEFQSTLEADLPPEDERPEIGLVSINSDFETGSFYVYPLEKGNGRKQYQDLGVHDAIGPHLDASYGEWDYEQLLEVDPDALVFSYGFSHATTEQFEERMDQMRDDPTGSELAAVRNDRLYRGGTAYQGPIINLHQTEIAAKQFYPDVFGAWNGLETLENADEQLVDHQRIADVVTGEF
ncbi:ABC transporter substrate-binding protein [Halopiger aswanensis]|uniref:Iron complex transport system substrate-binding protein n=1 Tax=Halopiger aswanensis TaxID=148449 RepID=A0A3R7E152_9EURY|nr:ABC transporter substrate-binding protein [Halopiger aswanensis]RKD97491.1 iron complex transport system substrate-binding protein [Halopiger aswanensis]